MKKQRGEPTSAGETAIALAMQRAQHKSQNQGTRERQLSLGEKTHHASRKAEATAKSNISPGSIGCNQEQAQRAKSEIEKCQGSKHSPPEPTREIVRRQQMATHGTCPEDFKSATGTGRRTFKLTGKGGNEYSVEVEHKKLKGRKHSSKDKKKKKKGAKATQVESAKPAQPTVKRRAENPVTKSKPKAKNLKKQPVVRAAQSPPAPPRPRLKPRPRPVIISNPSRSITPPLSWDDQTVLGQIFKEEVEDYSFIGANSGWSPYYDNPDGTVDLIIGLDFGTTFTKVVISEGGSGRSWAVPFSSNLKNPYLINSDVFLKNGAYQLKPDGDRIARLKIPFLSSFPDDEYCHHAVAFLALIIRFAKQWFMNEKKGFLREQKPFWFVNVGLPAKDFERRALVDQYLKLAWASLFLAVGTEEALDIQHVSSAYSHAKNAVTKGHDTLSASENILVYRDQLHIVPEIMAQLYGFIRSHHWDKNKPEFMLVDIGGGTIDSTIFNVVQEKDSQGFKFAIFNARVEPLGTINLHRKRANWILEQVQGSAQLPSFVAALEDLTAANSKFWMVPDRIEDYLAGARFGPRTLDQNFLTALKRVCLSEQLKYVLTKVNPGFLNSRRNYPVILAGGGSTNALYRKLFASSAVFQHVRIEELQLPKPDSLEMPGLVPQEYHRLSVAYGLSFDNLGKVLTPSQIKDLHIETGSSRMRATQAFVSKEMT